MGFPNELQAAILVLLCELQWPLHVSALPIRALWKVSSLPRDEGSIPANITLASAHFSDTEKNVYISRQVRGAREQTTCCRPRRWGPAGRPGTRPSGACAASPHGS